ncbi:MAG: GldG family protein [Verrucomicrobiae bacterium]|nr:GldG family protein [Verrucomicrobiae bacterium]
MRALVIAGPQKRFNEAELGALDQYLKSSGRLMVLLDYRWQTGLETLLERYGVQADDNLVVMPLLGMINVTAMGAEYARHPITSKLRGINTSFPYARSVRRRSGSAASSGERPEVTELIRTAEAYWGETNYSSQPIKFDANVDLQGPVPVAVAVETRKPGGVELDGMRLVVVGTSAFVDNQHIRSSGGNVDFFMNSLNWLLKREPQIAISPKTPEEFKLDMTTHQARVVYALVIGGMPLLVAVVGVAVWLSRRK